MEYYLIGTLGIAVLILVIKLIQVEKNSKNAMEHINQFYEDKQNLYVSRKYATNMHDVVNYVEKQLKKEQEKKVDRLREMAEEYCKIKQYYKVISYKDVFYFFTELGYEAHSTFASSGRIYMIPASSLKGDLKYLNDGDYKNYSSEQIKLEEMEKELRKLKELKKVLCCKGKKK